jgi:hypothetical protein
MTKLPLIVQAATEIKVSRSFSVEIGNGYGVTVLPGEEKESGLNSSRVLLFC